MALDLFGSQLLLQARHRLEAETPFHRGLRLSTRELWNAAEALCVEAGDLSLAQVTLHREAIAQVVGQLPVTTSQDDRPLLEATLAALPRPEQLPLLRRAHLTFLNELEADVATTAAIDRSRFLALGAVLLPCAVVVVFALNLVQWLREPVDLARGVPFTVSSKMMECHPDPGECGGYPTKVLFHTNEEEKPWYQVDLGAPKQISSLTIRNRTDEAMMRAVPLVVQVSDDGTKFREVARRTEVFVEWEPKFEPLTARFVRVASTRLTVLHLEAVRVHP